MFLKVKLNRQSNRGKTFIKDKSCKEPKQGILLGSKCSTCNETTDNTHQVKCNHCEKLYHITCTISPLTAESTADIKKSPYLWWTCLGCLMNETTALTSLDNDFGTDYGACNTNEKKILLWMM